MIIRELIKQTLTIAGKKYEYPDTEAIVGKINELARHANLVDPEEISNQFHALSMAIKHLTERVEKLEKEHIADTSKMIEPVTITDIFNEMQQVRADLWNKIEWLGEKLDEIKGGDNE